MSDTVYQTCQTADGSRFYKAWTRGVLWEKQAREQVDRLLGLPFVKEVAVMPDTHFGFGGPVGVAVRFEGAVIPSVVGVDIGCGMRAALIDVPASDLTPEVLPALRQALEETIPHGLTPGLDRGSWHDVPQDIRNDWAYSGLGDEYVDLCDNFLLPGQDDEGSMHGDFVLPPLRNGQTAQHRSPLSQLGTLGTGNHFFEVSVDQHGRVWCVVHSGSRGAGARIGDYFTKRAQDLMAKWHSNLPGDDRNLAFIPEGEEEYKGYIAFMNWAQKYAYRSRAHMMWRALNIAFPKALKRYGNVVEDFDIHHNYLDTMSMVARKGAVNVLPGQRAIIPGAMGARTYIVRGKPGLLASMDTCSHGAGRAMSRTTAERNVTLEQHQADLAGLECDRSEGTLDETTRAYKDVEAVLDAQSDLVEREFCLTAKVCVKGVGLLDRKRNKQ